MRILEKKANFINAEKLYALIEGSKSHKDNINTILEKARVLKGLTIEEAAILLNIQEEKQLQLLLDTASYVKKEIYGNRLVIFAPLYIGNKCSNNCLYCAFRKSNEKLHRVILSGEQIKHEVQALLKEGHKRILMLCGETNENDLNYTINAIRIAYSSSYQNHNIRRINVEIAPLEEKNFKSLREEKIGTYACFQETYDEALYSQYHPSGPKADYHYRLTVMNRAMKAGIHDVGIGALLGLADYRFEVLAMLEHARHLEECFDCGPHTVSVPRIEPAENAPLANHVPYPVSDNDFMKLIAVLRLSLPYTGIILSTREKSNLRSLLFQYGISQISAGSKTNPGAYDNTIKGSGSQFSLGDHRSLEEVILDLIEHEYIPSFCTGCYRKGREGSTFMELAKSGLIKKFCMPNALFTFKEYLLDFASQMTKENGEKLIGKLINRINNPELILSIENVLKKIDNKVRDIYF